MHIKSFSLILCLSVLSIFAEEIRKYNKKKIFILLLNNFKWLTKISKKKLFYF